LLIVGGPKETRTPDLLIANEALYQLSYGPFFCPPLERDVYYVIFYHRLLTFHREESMVTVTPTAAEKVKELLNETDGHYLRAFVQGGGCSGFQYGLMIDKEPGEADQVFESNGIKVLVDPVSISYLKGAEVDFNESAGGFTIKNPNATSTCGCGSSFNTDTKNDDKCH
jgi:iron-sulfur cluster assembly accessory protein